MDMQNKKQYGFGIIGIVIVVVAIALAGTLGLVLYKSTQQKKEDMVTDGTNTNAQDTTKSESKKVCADKDNTAAVSGVFCSEDIGVKFTVPSIFKGKMTKVANYDVFQGPIDQQPGQKAGTSELVYNAAINGTDNYALSVVKEPLRTGYNGTYHLQNAYFEKDSGILSQLGSTPTNVYDSKTDTTKVTGTYRLGEPVPSVNIDGLRFYKMQNSDAGYRSTLYLGVIKNKIIKIELKGSVYMGDPANDPSTISPDTLFGEFEGSVEKLKVLQ